MVASVSGGSIESSGGGGENRQATATASIPPSTIPPGDIDAMPFYLHHRRMIALAILGLALSGRAMNDVIGAEVLDLGSRRELFVDDHLIEKLDRVQLRLHEPRDEGAVMKFDEPWEGIHCGYCTVLEDKLAPSGKRFRVYYRGMPADVRKRGDRGEGCKVEVCKTRDRCETKQGCDTTPRCDDNVPAGATREVSSKPSSGNQSTASMGQQGGSNVAQRVARAMEICFGDQRFISQFSR